MIDYGMGGLFDSLLKAPGQLIQTAGGVVSSPQFQNVAATAGSAYLASQTGVPPAHMMALSGGRGVVGGNSQQQYWPENRTATNALMMAAGYPQGNLPMGPPMPPRGGVSPAILVGGGAALLLGAVILLRRK